jgi:hypothetical protein
MEERRVAAYAILEGLPDEVRGGLYEGETTQFDPSWVFLIMRLLAYILPILLDECDVTPEELSRKAAGNRRLHRVVLWLLCREVLNPKELRQLGGRHFIARLMTLGADPGLVVKLSEEI